MRLPLFRGVSADDIARYISSSAELRLEPGSVLLTPEEPNRFIYVILSGRLSVRLREINAAPFTTLMGGDCAGEMSVIDGQMPSAYVVAEEASTVLAIEEERIWELINASHAIAINFLHILSRRVRYGNLAIGDSEENATIDELTGLRNRRWMNRMFRREMQRCRFHGDPVALLMMDIDHFKDFNDKHGHLAGDQLLAGVASAITLRLRPSDLFARYGGEEFVLLLPNVSKNDAIAVAEKLRVAASEVEIKEDSDISLPPITVSIGIASMGIEDNLDHIIQRADQALYRAKAEGRNCVRVYGEH
jgi:diguanylate cyclase (GGDEF)-like protein